MPPFHGGGRGFESRPEYQESPRAFRHWGFLGPWGENPWVRIWSEATSRRGEMSPRRIGTVRIAALLAFPTGDSGT